MAAAADEAACVRWQEGNTTARHGGRLAAALDAWLADSLVGDPGSTCDRPRWAEAARASLDRRGASEARTADRSAAVKILGALERYGFLRAKLTRSHVGGPLAAWNESAGELTPAGARLVAAWRREDAVAVGECLLAAMALRALPSPIEDGWDRPSVNPVGLTASVLLALESADPREAFLSSPEFVRFVQTADGSSCPRAVADAIAAYREAKTRSADHQAFEAAALVSAAGAGHRRVQAASLESYADVAFRWYGETGVFVRSKMGRKTVLRVAAGAEARRAAQALARGVAPQSGLADPLTYLTRLEAGEFDLTAAAPVAAEIELRQRDTRRAAEALRQLLATLDSGLGMARTLHRVAAHDEATLAREQEAADNPLRDWPVVRELLLNLSDEADLGIEGLKPSAALEWGLFRALLLLVGPGSMETPAAQARRFQIAADLLPVGTAAGRGSDVELRCRDGLVFAGEATLTAGSRQAGTEGESVRRHVAELAGTTGPHGRAIGVFVAPTLDLNTMDWFRKGFHWIGNQPVAADIVPLTIAQMVALGDAAARRGGGSPFWLRDILDMCLVSREAGERPWLAGIAETVARVSGEGGGGMVLPVRRAAALAMPPVAVRRRAPATHATGQGSLFDQVA